jgi:hypothetical protein
VHADAIRCGRSAYRLRSRNRRSWGMWSSANGDLVVTIWRTVSGTRDAMPRAITPPRLWPSPLVTALPKKIGSIKESGEFAQRIEHIERQAIEGAYAACAEESFDKVTDQGVHSIAGRQRRSDHQSGSAVHAPGGEASAAGSSGGSSGVTW